MGLLDLLFPGVARRRRARQLGEAQARAYQRNSEPKVIEAAKQRLAPQAKPCPNCDTPPEQLAWSYFESSVDAWSHGAGAFGWQSSCPHCFRDVETFVEGLG